MVRAPLCARSGPRSCCSLSVAKRPSRCRPSRANASAVRFHKPLVSITVLTEIST